MYILQSQIFTKPSLLFSWYCLVLERALCAFSLSSRLSLSTSHIPTSSLVKNPVNLLPEMNESN